MTIDIKTITQIIDAEIAKRQSKGFGIKVGIELYRELCEAGYITMEKFNVMGTGAFELELPAYKKTFAVAPDWTMEDDDFEVGMP
ncbi:MAG: hypothetical protein OXM58_17525 [Rhodospirillaceae bacterium]|nr:hypothetical protein [Rhodospirillaceae bacterium]MDE0617582.1 hypothetical protein [Rhodospirillaceae bacterium]